jgi:threonine/homoserine/homoserine lactone efflux protein
MNPISVFLVACCFSFLGSIPPGTLNLTILQLGLDEKIKIAWRFSLAAALVEYPYAWIAVELSSVIQTSPIITEYFELIGAVVMTTLGILNLYATQKPASAASKFQQSGFRRGILLSILNPLVLPFWVGITAYLQSQQWIDLTSATNLHAYLLGVSMGALTLLIAVTYLAKKVARHFRNNVWIRRIPGITLVVLGIYALLRYIL